MNKIIEIPFGSTLYGTRTPDSDIDIKGIYLPTAKEIVLQTYKPTIQVKRNKAEKERNTKDDVDQEFFSLDRYLELLMEGQTVALDMLFSPEFHGSIVSSDPSKAFIIAPIYENREKLLTRNVSTFIGYAKQQAARYGVKGSRMDSLKRTKKMLDGLMGTPYTKLQSWPDTINDLIKECDGLISLEKTPLVEMVMLKGPKGEMDAPHLRVNGRSIPFHATVKYAKEVVDKMLDGYGQRATKAHLAGGKDFKAISHCLRVCSEAAELLETGNITFPRPDKEILVKVKLGLIPYEEVENLMEKGIEQIKISQLKSTLKDNPDKEWAENFIYEIYSKIVKQS